MAKKTKSKEPETQDPLVPKGELVYSVIYEVDCGSETDLSEYTPPDLSLWNETEDTSDDYSDIWPDGQHRKWCAVLSEKQFAEFVQRVGLSPNSTPTAGSFGAPGYGFGWAPAIAFTNDDPSTVQSAYVTPSGTAEQIIDFLLAHDHAAEDIPECLRKPQRKRGKAKPNEELAKQQDRVWEMLRDTVIGIDWYAVRERV